MGNSDPDAEALVTCPYDKSHRIRKCVLQTHLHKCSRNHGYTLSRCSFDVTHHVHPNELKEHEAQCPKRRSFDASLYKIGETTLHIPVEKIDLPPADEDWDDGMQGGYDPHLIDDERFLIRSKICVAPSERKAFQRQQCERAKKLAENTLQSIPPSSAAQMQVSNNEPLRRPVLSQSNARSLTVKFLKGLLLSKSSKKSLKEEPLPTTPLFSEEEAVRESIPVENEEKSLKEEQQALAEISSEENERKLSKEEEQPVKETLLKQNEGKVCKEEQLVLKESALDGKEGKSYEEEHSGISKAGVTASKWDLEICQKQKKLMMLLNLERIKKASISSSISASTNIQQKLILAKSLQSGMQPTDSVEIPKAEAHSGKCKPLDQIQQPSETNSSSTQCGNVSLGRGRQIIALLNLRKLESASSAAVTMSDENLSSTDSSVLAKDLLKPSELEPPKTQQKCSDSEVKSTVVASVGNHRKLSADNLRSLACFGRGRGLISLGGRD